mgnify:CR=1 FL=1
MSDNYEGKDGLARDLAKLKYEEKAIYRALGINCFFLGVLISVSFG